MRSLMLIASVASCQPAYALTNDTISFEPEEKVYGLSAEHITCVIAMVYANDRDGARDYAKAVERKYQTEADRIAMFQEIGMFGLSSFAMNISHQDAVDIMRMSGEHTDAEIRFVALECKNSKV